MLGCVVQAIAESCNGTLPTSAEIRLASPPQAVSPKRSLAREWSEPIRKTVPEDEGHLGIVQGRLGKRRHEVMTCPHTQGRMWRRPAWNHEVEERNQLLRQPGLDGPVGRAPARSQSGQSGMAAPTAVGGRMGQCSSRSARTGSGCTFPVPGNSDHAQPPTERRRSPPLATGGLHATGGTSPANPWLHPEPRVREPAHRRAATCL